MGDIKGGKNKTKQNMDTLMNWSNRSLTGIKKGENLGQAILKEIMAEKFKKLKDKNPLV